MELYIEMEKAFQIIEKRFFKDELNAFRQAGFAGMEAYHFGLGTWIRNHILTENSKLYQHFLSGGVVQKDDMSALIIKLFYLYIQMKYQLQVKIKH